MHILIFMKENNESIGNQKAANYAVVCAAFNLRKASRAISSLYDDYMRQAGFRATQATLMMVLQQAGRISIARLSEILIMDRTTVARDLQPLVREGLVAITEGEDRRVRIIELTSSGHEALARVLPMWEQAQERIIDDFGEERYQSLLGELNMLVRVIRRD